MTQQPAPEQPPIDRRVVRLSLLSIAIGVAASFIAVALMKLIALITNLAFYGNLSIAAASPAGNSLGLFVVLIPVMGALVVGVMARFGSKAIRGHGIPEAMEQVLTNRSRIPARLTILKPLSAAISIGTGGPFGAEGPIIATGGALGSLIGQCLETTAIERKTLLAVGAAAGMAATFGSPVAAVLLAVELLLFEFRPRSIIPVALGAATAAGMRVFLEGAEPVFAMPNIAPPSIGANVFYIALGGMMGTVAVGITWIVYLIEDSFERLPVHWMWWPAIGAVAVGVVGYFEPRTLGVGYENISMIISDGWTTKAILFLCLLKAISWSVSLGSGTSGGTLAPMFTIGGGIGHLFGAVAVVMLPMAGIDVRVAALVGMAAIFAGASRAFLASAVFAFETTQQVHGLLPLLGGCTASYLIAMLLTKNSIMTEKIARRGVRTPSDFVPDPLSSILVSQIATTPAVTLTTMQTVEEVRQWISAAAPGSTHQGFPVVDQAGSLRGVVTRRDLLKEGVPVDGRVEELIRHLPRFVYDDCTARQAADHMVNHNIGRLPVISRQQPHSLVGIVTRSDILSGYRLQMDEAIAEKPTISIPGFKKNKDSIGRKVDDDSNS
ncbi:MAG: chloride channel protein [Planctomycetaceae bacterium]|nr:chloride channel protein [Planctomycetaceae bacterium]MCB9941746.1 chloride channel protein [Planctomycetaceae bacterium]